MSRPAARPAPKGSGGSRGSTGRSRDSQPRRKVLIETGNPWRGADRHPNGKGGIGGPPHQQFRSRLGNHLGRPPQGRIRILAWPSATARLWAQGGGGRIPRRHARRHRLLPDLEINNHQTHQSVALDQRNCSASEISAVSRWACSCGAFFVITTSPLAQGAPPPRPSGSVNGVA